MADNRQHKIRALETLLVLDAKAGSKAAFDRLAALRGDRLVAHAARLSADRDAAHDIAQEAWVQITRGLPALKDDTAFLPWALCIVSRQVAAHIKTRQKHRKLAEAYVPEAETVITPSCDRKLDADTVRSALKHLTPAQYATIALFYLEDMSIAEVARATDVPVGTVKTRLMSARSTLKTFLEGDNDG